MAAYVESETNFRGRNHLLSEFDIAVGCVKHDLVTINRLQLLRTFYNLKLTSTSIGIRASGT